MITFNNINKFKSDGVIVIKNFISKLKANEIQNKLQDYLERNKFKLKGKDINYINGEVNSLHNIKDKYFIDICKGRKVIDTCSKLLNTNVKFKHCEYFAKPAKIGLASPMHQDNYYWNLKNPNAVTMWIALTPATNKNGTLEYLIGSHKLGKVKHEASYAPGSSQKVNNLKKYRKFKKKSYNLSVGDCIIHHCEIIHGSQANKSKMPRMGFTIQIMDKNTSVDKVAFMKYQKSLKYQIKKRLI
jgi:phytanoyl-CoA hydroxylase